MFVAVCFSVQYSLRKGLSEQWGSNAVSLASSARSRFAFLLQKRQTLVVHLCARCIVVNPNLMCMHVFETQHAGTEDIGA